MAGLKIDIRDLRDGKFLWIDKAALELVSAKAGNRGVSVYAWLCYYANARGQDCYPSLKTLSVHCHVSVRTVRRTVKRLESVRAIEIFREKGKGNVYRLLDIPDREKTVDSGVTGDNGVRGVGTPMSLLPGSPVSPKQELIEQELFNKTTARSIFSADSQPSDKEMKALTALFFELKDRIDLVAFLKTYRKKHGGMPPAEVIIKVCEQFKAQGKAVRDVWPWFERVLRAEAGVFNATAQVKAHAVIKREPVLLGDIMAGIAMHGP